MSLQQVINYNNAANFTYDNTKVEFSGSVSRLKDLTPSGSVFGSLINPSGVNARWGNGTLTGVNTGSVTYVGGKAVFLNSLIDWAGPNNITNLYNVGTIKFKITFNFTGSPASNMNIFTLSQSSGVNNVVRIYKDTSNAWRIYSTTSAGAVIQNGGVLGTTIHTSGIEYEFAYVWDFVSGYHRLYINGVATSVARTAISALRNNFFENVRIGSSNSNFSIRDVVLYNSALYTGGSYTPGYSLPETRYAIDDPTILYNSTFESDAIELLSESPSSQPAGSSVQYCIRVNNQDKYYNGSAWVNSDGTYAQSNTRAQINAAISSLDISSGASIGLKAILRSDDGSVRPSLTSNTFDYNFFQPPGACTACVVWGYVYNECNPVEGATVSFKSKSPFFLNGNLIAIDKTVETSATGYFEIELPVSVTASQLVDITAKWTDTSLKAQSKKITGYIPNQASVNWEDI